MSNNLLKKRDLEERGIEITEIEQLVAGGNPHNRRDIEAKRQHGHFSGKIPTRSSLRRLTLAIICP